jgi:hypothetical protein
MPSALGESGPDRGRRPSYRVDLQDHLDGVAGHDDEVELLIPGARGSLTEDPLDIRPLPCLLQHRPGGVDPSQSAGVPGLPGQAQQLIRSAADIEHALR